VLSRRHKAQTELEPADTVLFFLHLSILEESAEVASALFVKEREWHAALRVVPLSAP
jgi:hypothetical protein